MESRRPGEGMEMHVNKALLVRARREAARMSKAGERESTVAGVGGDESEAVFHLKRNADAMFVLGEIEEGGETFYLGLEDR